MDKTSDMNLLSPEIQYFIAVARQGNISKAAKSLGITQPSLSAAIQKLEKNLGQSLFSRHRNGVILTRLGRQALERFQDLDFEQNRTYQQLLKNKEEVSGIFILGAHPAIAANLLPEVLASIAKSYPGIELQFRHGPSLQMIEDLQNGEIHLALVAGDIFYGDLVQKKLFTDEVKLFSLQGLKNENKVLLCNPQMVGLASHLKLLEKKGFLPERILRTTEYDLIAELVLEGVGVGLLPQSIVNRKRTKKIQAVGGIGTLAEIPISLAYQKRDRESLSFQKIIETFSKEFST